MTKSTSLAHRLAAATALAAALLASVQPALGIGPTSGGGEIVSFGDDGVGGIERTTFKPAPWPTSRSLGVIFPSSIAPPDDGGSTLWWTDLGQGIPGPAGLPALSPSTEGLLLESAQAGSTVHVVLGLAAVDLPYRGGHLVPRPDLVLPALTVSDDGSLVVPFGWVRALPVDSVLYAQAWVASEGSAAASNAIALTVR